MPSQKIFDYSAEIVETASDISEMVKIVTIHYISKGIFIHIVDQTVRKGKSRPDFIAYNYSTDTSISVETELSIEEQSHPEHVRFNMLKWRDMGFLSCYVWSKHQGIQDEYDKLSKENR